MVLFLSVLGHDMERGAQISVYMGHGSMGVMNEVWHFSSSNKNQGSFTAFSSISTEEGWQKQTTASEFPAVQQATNDRQERLATAWCCFSQCWVVTWNVVLKSLCTWAVGVMNEVWHFSSSNKNQRKFHGVQFNVHWRRLTKANHCIRSSGCSANNQRPTKKAGNGMVLFLSVLGFYMIAKWTWIMNHGMTRVYSEGWNFHSGFILACPLDLFWEAFNSWWRLLDACADSGCLCGFGFWQHYVWIYSCNLVSPADEPPSFPGTLSEIRVHERHTLVNSLNLERVKWDEMITIMSCCYVSMSCHGMACRHGWFLAWPPCHFWRWEFCKYVFTAT